MQTKDVFTITISAIALVLSAISLIVTLKQRTREMKRSIRNQMSPLYS